MHSAVVVSTNELFFGQCKKMLISVYVNCPFYFTCANLVNIFPDLRKNILLVDSITALQSLYYLYKITTIE